MVAGLPKSVSGGGSDSSRSDNQMANYILAAQEQNYRAPSGMNPDVKAYRF